MTTPTAKRAWADLTDSCRQLLAENRRLREQEIQLRSERDWYAGRNEELERDLDLAAAQLESAEQGGFLAKGARR